MPQLQRYTIPLFSMGTVVLLYMSTHMHRNPASDTLVAYYQTNRAHPMAMDRAIRLFSHFYPTKTSHKHKLRSISRIRNYTTHKEGMYFTDYLGAELYLQPEAVHQAKY